MGSTLRFIALSAASVTLAACGGASSPEDLAEETVGYLASNDFTGYFEETVVTPQQFLELCPATKDFSVDQARYQERFTRCLGKADFANAEIVNIAPKKGFKSTAECGGSEPVETADEIEVTISAPNRVYTFKLKGALATADGWRVASTLDCD